MLRVWGGGFMAAPCSRPAQAAIPLDHMPMMPAQCQPLRTSQVVAAFHLMPAYSLTEQPYSSRRTTGIYCTNGAMIFDSHCSVPVARSLSASLWCTSDPRVSRTSILFRPEMTCDMTVTSRQSYPLRKEYAARLRSPGDPHGPDLPHCWA